MAGSVGAPTPWWQLPGAVGKSGGAVLDNLTKSAPAGYQYDPVKMNYVPIAGSATDVLAQRTRSQGIEDNLLNSYTGAGAGTTPGSGGAAPPTVGYPTTTSPSVSWPGSSSSGTGGGGPISMSSSGQLPQGGANPPGGAPGGTMQPSVHIAVPDTSAAMAAVFNRAKDKVGQTTSGSLSALRSALASRGLTGGGVEGKTTGNLITAGAGQLADTSREQAIQESQRQNDFAKLGYQGDIEQRGQDITTSEGAANRALTGSEGAANRALAALEAQYSGQITQRGQDIGQNEAIYGGGITQRGQDLNYSAAMHGQNLGGLTALLNKLY